MVVTDALKGADYEAIVEPIHAKDFKKIKASREFGFDWNKNSSKEVYKLRLENSDTILGLIGLSPYPESGFNFLTIDMLEVGKSNVGRMKQIDRIAGCLLAFACRRSFTSGCSGYVMLESKTEIVALYHKKYGFEFIGGIGLIASRMVSDSRNSQRIISEYDG